MQFSVEYVKRAFFGALVLSVLAGATAAHAGKIKSTYKEFPRKKPPYAELTVQLTEWTKKFDDLHIRVRKQDKKGLFKIVSPPEWSIEGISPRWGNKMALDLIREPAGRRKDTIVIRGPIGRNKKSLIELTIETRGLLTVSGEPTFASPVPEPASLSLLALGALGVLRRRT